MRSPTSRSPRPLRPRPPRRSLGHPFHGEPSGVRKHDRRLVKDTARSLRGYRGPMEGERRIVTMLFCDVVGSTAMAERLDPEAWTDIMNEVFQQLIAPIDRYEGTTARLMGDAIFALFGAPTAHEDDPQRAGSAGLEVVAAVGADGEERVGGS